MALSNIAVNTTTSSGADLVFTVPTVARGDLATVWMFSKAETTTHTALATWTKFAEVVGGTGTLGVDTGKVKATLFTKTMNGTESATTDTWVIPDNDVTTGIFMVTRADSGYYDLVSGFGDDVTGGADWSTVSSVNQDIRSGDILYAGCGIPTSATVGSWTSETLTATGLTVAAAGATQYVETNTGNNMAARLIAVSVSAGISTAAATHVATVPVTNTGVTGPEIYLRVREAPGDIWIPVRYRFGPADQDSNFIPWFGSPLTTVNVFAESVEVTVVVDNSTSSVNSGAENVAITLSNDNSTPIGSSNTATEAVLVTAAANDTTVTRTAEPQAEVVAVVVVTNDAAPAGASSALAENVSITATANDTTSSVATGSDFSAVTATVDNAISSTASSASSVDVTATANDATVVFSKDAAAEAVAVSGVVNDATGSVSSSAEAVTAISVANDAVVGTAGDTFPTVADVTVSVDDAIVVISEVTDVTSGSVSVTASANDATITITASPGSADVVATSNNTSTTISTTLQEITVSTVANDGVVSTESVAFADAEAVTVSVTTTDSTSTVNVGSSTASISVSIEDLRFEVITSAEGVVVVSDVLDSSSSIAASTFEALATTSVEDAPGSMFVSAGDVLVDVVALNISTQPIHEIPSDRFIIQQSEDDVFVISTRSDIFIIKEQN